MTAMLFQHFAGKDICSTVEEVCAAFDKTVNGVNEFIISSGADSQYPYLSILVNGRSAYIFYAPFDGSIGAGFQAYGEDEDDFILDPDGLTVFYVNTPTEEITIGNDYVCTKEKALQVIQAFMSYPEWPTYYDDLPDCVDWEEL